MSTIHVFSNRHIKDQVVNIKKGDWIYLENSVSKNRWSLYFNYNDINEKKLKLTYITQDEFFALNTENGMKMTFDAICINPPYQDNTVEDNQQNKIYNQFSKKALELLSPTGTLTAITPVAVANKSKRFSLTETPGIKEIDFTANNHFDVGAKICKWIVDRNHTGNIKVVSDNGISYAEFGNSVYDPSVTDIDFAQLVEKLQTIPIENRAFKQNIYATTSSTKEKTNDNIYPLHKLNAEGKLFPSVYVKKEPFFYNSKKLSISRSKSFRDEIILIGKDDLDTQYVNIEIENEEQIENIKSFLFSDYFINHMDSWKKLYNTGFNDALKYVPPFDKNKMWTNKEVEELFNDFRNS